MTAPERGNHYRPGEAVPVDGIYRCDVGSAPHEDHVFRPGTPEVEGMTFPALPGGCDGINWVLAQAIGQH